MQRVRPRFASNNIIIVNTWPSIKEPSTCSNAKASKTDREGPFITRNLAQASRNVGGPFLLGGDRFC